MWVLPTAGRAARCQEALDALILSGVATPGIIIVDGDPDPAYRALRLPEGWRVEFRAESVGPLAIFEDVFAANPDLPWYGWLADDAFVRSGPGWDRALIAKAGPRGVASPDDGWQSGKRITWGAVFGGDLVRACGWWMPPTLKHLYADDAWEAIGSALGLWRYIPDVLVEHRHVFNGKAEADATHATSYRAQSEEAQLWSMLSRNEIPAAISRIRDEFDLPEDAEAARLAHVKTRSVMICTPVHRGPSWQYTKAYAETWILLDRLGVRVAGQFQVGSSNLPKARNELTDHFLNSSFTDLVFIDADMGWHANDVVRLLASDKEVIGGVGRKKFDIPKTDMASWCMRLLPGSEKSLQQDAMGAIEVLSIGTGFLKITRSALERIRDERPDLQRESYTRFFRFNDDDGGEDYEFCALWRSVGGSIWLDPEIELVHAGEHEYTGRFGDLLVSKATQIQEAA